MADVQGGKATVWSATQAVYPLRSTMAMVLGTQSENVHIIFKMGSGCYGCNGADTVSYDAALLSQAVGKPVRVQLTRKDEMAWENYGLAFVIDQRAGIDAPTRGTHQFRHGLATEMLRQGASLGEIGEVLGHRHPQTTTIYAKVDINALRTLALPWPGGAR